MAKAPHYVNLAGEMPVGLGARIVVETLWGAVFELAPSALRGDDTRAVHDMRVGIRRMRAAMASLAEAFPAREARATRRAIRRLGRKLGAVRDADVHLAMLRATLAGAVDSERLGIVFAIESLIDVKRAALAAYAIELSQFDRNALTRLLADG